MSEQSLTPSSLTDHRLHYTYMFFKEWRKTVWRGALVLFCQEACFLLWPLETIKGRYYDVAYYRFSWLDVKRKLCLGEPHHVTLFKISAKKETVLVDLIAFLETQQIPPSDSF